nr:hypothetical protein [Tanacetum cinerariifolium]
MIRKQVGDLSTHTNKYTSPALTQKVFANMRRVGKGFSGVDTPLFEGMLVEQQGIEEEDADENDEDVNAGDTAEGDDAGIPINLLQEVIYTCTALTRRVDHLEFDKVAQALEITKLKRRVKKLERRNKVKVLKLRRLQKVGTTQRVQTSDETVKDDVSNQGRMIAEMDQDADVVLEDDKEVVDEAKEVAEDAKVDESVDIQGRQAEIYKIDLDHANKVLSMQDYETEPAEVQEVVDVVTTAKLITEVVTAAIETITAASINITAVEAQVPAVTLTTAPARVTAAPSRRRKGVVIRDLQEESTTSTIIPAETKSKDKGKGILVKEPKPLKKKQQIEQDKQYARELQAELNKNIDWDVAIDHVKKKAKEDPVVKRYQVLKRKPQIEAQARKNMMDAGIPINLLQEVIYTCTALIRRVEHLELDKVAQALEITKLKRRVKKLERRNKVKVLKLRRLQKVGTAQRVQTSDETVKDDISNQGRMIAEMDQDADVVLEDDKEVVDEAKEVAEDAKVDESVDIQGRQAEIYKIDLDHANKVLSMQDDETEPAEVQEVVDVVTTAKLITEVITAASETITAASINITSVEAQVPAVTLTTAPARVTAAPSRRRKGVVIRDLQEESTTSTIIPAETKSKDKGKGILVKEPKPLKKKQQIEQDKQYARELQAELNKNIDWDVAIDHV